MKLSKQQCNQSADVSERLIATQYKKLVFIAFFFFSVPKNSVWPLLRTNYFNIKATCTIEWVYKRKRRKRQSLCIGRVVMNFIEWNERRTKTNILFLEEGWILWHFIFNWPLTLTQSIDWDWFIILVHWFINQLCLCGDKNIFQPSSKFTSVDSLTLNLITVANLTIFDNCYLRVVS